MIPICPTEYMTYSYNSVLVGDIWLNLMVLFTHTFSVFRFKTVKLNEDKLCVSIATPYRLGSGRVLPPISGVQRQSGVTILQRPGTPGRLPGNTHKPRTSLLSHIHTQRQHTFIHSIYILKCCQSHIKESVL